MIVNFFFSHSRIIACSPFIRIAAHYDEEKWKEISVEMTAYL